MAERMKRVAVMIEVTREGSRERGRRAKAMHGRRMIANRSIGPMDPPLPAGNVPAGRLLAIGVAVAVRLRGQPRDFPN